MKQLALVLVACSIALVLLASNLRPDAFFVGDPGVKLIATRAALQTPSTPLDVPLPHIGHDAVPHVEPFFWVHDNTHAHAVTSEVFPLLSAPLLASVGVRGLYILPALGFIATLAACAWLGFILDERRSAALVAAGAALGTPFLFYGLEFWEHAPALALGVAGAAWMLAAARQRPGGHSDAPSTFLAGLLFGGAVMLRPESAGFMVAVMLASRALVHRPTWRSVAITLAGAAVAMVPLEAYTLWHFGSVIPGHVGTNAGLIGESWWAGRLHVAADWLLPSMWTQRGPVHPSGFWSVSPAAVLAVLGLTRATERRQRIFLWLVALLTTLFVLAAAPNDGGGQWGPRYLLFAYVPLLLLAVDTLQELPRRRLLASASIVVVLAASIWVQRAAYRSLRGTKATYGRLVDFVATNAEPGANVVTDLWWLDQLAASALDGRNVLYAPDSATVKDIVQRLSDTTTPSAVLFRSRDESVDVRSWSDDTCYFEEFRDELPVRGLVAIHLRHRCGYKPQ
ncbi:MAG: hypothetical protein ABL982_03650 [Vicinamibacterales bacterium]